jgi:hypothetical protein
MMSSSAAGPSKWRSTSIHFNPLPDALAAHHFWPRKLPQRDQLLNGAFAGTKVLCQSGKVLIRRWIGETAAHLSPLSTLSLARASISMTSAAEIWVVFSGFSASCLLVSGIIAAATAALISLTNCC